MINSRTRYWLQRAADGSVFLVFVFAVFAIVRLLARQLDLTQTDIELATTSLATAICFILSSAAIYGLLETRSRGSRVWLWRAAALITVSTATYVLAGYVLGVADAGYLFGLSYGRMSPATAVSFILVGMATLTADYGKGRLSATLVTIGLVVIEINLVAQAYGAEALYEIPPYSSMALLTALAFGILLVGLLLSRPDQGWIQYVFRDDRVGIVSRVLLPAVIIIPLVLTDITARGTSAGLWAPLFGFTVLAIAMTVMLGALVGFVSIWLSRVDAALRDEIEERRRMEQKMRGLLDAAPDAMIIVDPQGRVQLASHRVEALFGYTPKELLDRSIDALLPERFRLFHDAHMQRYMHAPEERNMGAGLDLFARRKDGSEFPVEISLSPDRSGEELVVIAAVRDITDRKAVEAQLRQAQKMEALGTLTGGMAHDFNNLLGITIGNLDLLRERLGDDPASDELADEALSAALRGADLTQRLLAFARRQPLQPKRLEPNALVTNIVKLLGRTLGETIEITLDLSPDVAMIKADPAQLEASITNLANNARDAMPMGGSLRIVTANKYLDADYTDNHAELSPGNYVMIEISDTGTGMSPETIAQAFEPFFSTKGEKGTGLGLSMVFGFVNQSGGHIEVHSIEGVGTSFRIYLPCDKSGVDGVNVPVLDTPLAERGHETVLAVEDNEGLRNVVRRQLTQLGYKCLEADSGVSALAVLEREQVDLLFTDVIMPGGMSGYDLGQTALSRWPGIKVLLTSGFPEEKLKQNGGAQSDLRLLIKPYRKEDLARALRETLDE
jgi:PAS domain S-box-containing protein